MINQFVKKKVNQFNFFRKSVKLGEDLRCYVSSTNGVDTNINGTQEAVGKGIIGSYPSRSSSNDIRSSKLMRQSNSVKLKPKNLSNSTGKAHQNDLVSQEYIFKSQTLTQKDTKLPSENLNVDQGPSISSSIKIIQPPKSIFKSRAPRINIQPTIMTRLSSPGVSQYLPAPPTHITKNRFNTCIDHSVPCVFLQYSKRTTTANSFVQQPDQMQNKLIIYFHANGEDLDDILPICRQLNTTLEVTCPSAR